MAERPEAGEWESMPVVGRIARAHGNRGHVIINPTTDFPDERFAVGRVLYLRRHGSVEPVTVTASRLHRGRPIVGLSGVASMNAAEELAGLELRVPEAALLALPADTFYHHDLVGCDVVTVGGEPVGCVVAVEGPLGGGRLVVAGRRGEILIPLAGDICVGVDVARHRIDVDPPPGLLDLNG